MPPRLLNVGPLISSNYKNRRIRKWKWCSFRHQTLPGWAIVWAFVWVFSAQENNRCRIGLLIPSNRRNRRIRKWKWCSCRRQTVPGWAIVLAIVWAILRTNGPGSSGLAQVDYYVSTCLLSSVLCFCIFCSFGWGKTKVVKEDFLIACWTLCSAGRICVSYDSGVIIMCFPFELSIRVAYSCTESSDKL